MKIMCVFKGVGEEDRGEEPEEGVDCACVECAWRGRGATFEGAPWLSWGCLLFLEAVPSLPIMIRYKIWWNN